MQAEIYVADGCYKLHDILIDEGINLGSELWYEALTRTDQFTDMWYNKVYWAEQEQRWPWGTNETRDGFVDPNMFSWEVNAILPRSYFHS